MPGSQTINRLYGDHRIYSTKKTRKLTTHKRKKRSLIVPTEAERALGKARRAAERAEFKDALKEARVVVLQEAIKLRNRFGGHSVTYYYERLMQMSRLNRGKRAVNLWNAFLVLEIQRHNEEIPDDEKRLKVSAISRAAASKWNLMSRDEQKKAAEPGIALLEEAREVKLLAKRNTALSAMQDARATLKNIEGELRALHARTGVESFLIGVRSKPDQYGKPFLGVSSKRADQFFDLAVCETLPEFALRFEAFCLSGVQGVAGNYVQQTLQKKHELANLILAKLRDIAGTNVPRMYYKNFDDNITAKYGVIIKGWPLDRFCNPSDLTSRNKVEVLHASFLSGATRFEKLTTAELAAWDDARFNALNAPTQPSPEIEIGSPVTPPDADGTNTDGLASPSQPSAPPPTSAAPSTSGAPPTLTASSATTTAPTAIRPPLVTMFVNTITSTTGAPVVIAKKPRKERSDKGAKRGPRTKK